PTERSGDAAPPGAEVVEDALHDNGAVVGHRAGRSVLIVEILQKIARRFLVEIVLFRQPGDGLSRLHGPHFADETSDLRSEWDGALRGIRSPERHLARLARRRRDHDAIVRDLFDSPGRRAEKTRFASS